MEMTPYNATGQGAKLGLAIGLVMASTINVVLLVMALEL